MRRRLLGAGLAGLLTLPLLAASGGKDRRGPQEPRRSGLSFGSETAVVTVPVFVTDKNGKAVSGLTPADFTVKEDGKKRPIVALREIDSSKPEPSVTGRQALYARRQFLLLFDLSFSSVPGLVRARGAALDFVRKQLSPSDLAAVATFSLQHGVKLLVGFTEDRVQLEQAIGTLDLIQQHRQADPLGIVFDFGLEAEGPDLVKRWEEKSPGQGFDVIDELRQQVMVGQNLERSEYTQRVQSLLRALDQLARLLDSIQGRKQVLYFSAGFDDSALAGVRGKKAFETGEAVTEGRLWDVQSDTTFGDAATRDRARTVIESFAASDTVVHTVDVTGLAVGVDASEGGRGPRIGAGRESLSELAHESGGIFIRNANDLNAGLAEILEASRRYYLLVYEPAATRGDGRFHKIDVKVRGKGLTVSHRSGYRDRPRSEAVPALVRRLQAAEAIVKGATGGDIALDVLAVPYRDKEGRVSLPVILDVPGDAFLDEGGRSKATIDIFGYALDEKGTVEDTVASRASLDLAKWGERIRAGGIQVQTAFRLSPGRHSLRFLVRDDDTGRRGFLAADAVVPSFKPGALLLYPPLFMESPGESLTVPLPSHSLHQVEMPFRVQDQTFIPRIRPRLVGGEKQSICIMAFTGQSGAAGSSPDLQIKAQLLDAAGHPVRLGRLRVARNVSDPDGFRRLVLDVTPGELGPGDYALRVRISDPATGATQEASQTVRVF